MTAITQVIDDIGTAPDPVTQTPTAFSLTAAAMVVKQKAMVPQMNTWAGQANTVAGEVNTALSAAQAAQDAAAASAASAITAPGTNATSATSMTVGTGSKAFTLAQTGKNFVVGQWVMVNDSATPTTNWMIGAITAFTTGTGAITVNVTTSSGSLTGSSWVVTPTSPVPAKDLSGGLAGLTLFKLNMKNVAGTFTSFMTNVNTAARTYTWQDRDGTVADLGTQTFAGAQRCAIVQLTDGATITPDFSLSNMFEIALGGNRTLALPTNCVEGQQGTISVHQDATGSRTLTPAWGYQFALGADTSLSTIAGTRDVIGYSVDTYKSSTVTISLATPGVVTMNGHGLYTGQKVRFTTTVTLPTGLALNTTYFVKVIDANTFNVATTLANACAGTLIATSGGSGTHSMVACSITLNYNKAIS